jgi:BirA family biotin operon repressor/biotin-[acetyl-CoA-carboxylase] ligase
MGAPSAERLRANERSGSGAARPAEHEALHAEALTAGARRQWLGTPLHLFAELDSTNRFAQELAAGGAPHGACVIADAQSAGRGRLGRSFFSPPRTNLYVSFVLRPAQAGAELGTLPLAAGVALAESVAAELGAAERVALKWPNDVLADGKKLSGILLERSGASAEAPVILGIGVNLNVDPASFPDDFRARASSLAAAAGRTIERARFASALFDRLEHALDLHADGGFSALRPRFDAFFRMLGQRVRIADAAARVREGEVLGIGADGSLRLGTHGGEERFYAGDVTLLKDGNP